MARHASGHQVGISVRMDNYERHNPQAYYTTIVCKLPGPCANDANSLVELDV